MRTALPPTDDRKTSIGNDWLRRLRKDLTWVIVVKLLLIAVLFGLFFSSAHRPLIDASSVERHILPSK